MAFLGIQISESLAKSLKKIDVPGERTPSDEYHITILHFGDNWDISEAAKALEVTYNVLKTTKPFKAKIKKINCFPAGENGAPIFAEVESTKLIDLSKKLKKEFDKEKIDYSKLHKDFTPHITLSYAKKEIEPQKIDLIEFDIDEIVIWGGDNGKEKFILNFPLNEKIKKSYLLNKTDLFYKISQI